MEISVIFPGYNEEQNVRETLLRALKALRARFERFEIIVVNDCSTDATGSIADELAAAHPEIVVLHNPRNLGQTASILRAFDHVRYRLVTHDAMDYALDLCDLDLMLPLLAEADIVVAARDQRAGYSLYRKLVSHINLFILHTFFDLRLSDYNFTQIYPKSYLDKVNVISRSAGFVTPELLFRANDMGLRIKEVQVPYQARTRGLATAGNPRIVFASLMDLLRFWWLRLRGRTKAVAQSQI